MKIVFSRKIQSKFVAAGGVYALDTSNKYAAAIHDYRYSAEVINLRTGLVIGYLAHSQAIDRESGFKRAWGFRKDLGKNGRVLKSAIN